jgi:hypothetical protein
MRLAGDCNAACASQRRYPACRARGSATPVGEQHEHVYLARRDRSLPMFRAQEGLRGAALAHSSGILSPDIKSTELLSP